MHINLHFACKELTLVFGLVIFGHHAFRKSCSYMISFCNLIGGLSELLEVNGLNSPMLPGSFLPHAERGNEPGDEASVRQVYAYLL